MKVVRWRPTARWNVKLAKLRIAKAPPGLEKLCGLRWLNADETRDATFGREWV